MPEINIESKIQKHVAVDLRSLHTSKFSGVESFAVNVLEHLLGDDRETIYRLFYNGYTPKQFEYFHFINTQYKQTRIPNRLLNLSLKFFNYPKLESLTGPCDVLFMPNWNMLAISAKTPVVLTIHDLSPQLLPQFYNIKARLWHWFINIPKLVKRADRLIAVSEFTKTSIIEKMGVAPDKIIVAPLGVDHENYRPNLGIDKLREVRNTYGLPGDFVLFVGTVEPRKNLPRLIEAMEQLKEPLSLVIVGRLGWKYSALLKQIENSPKRRSIKLLGYIPEADKPYIMKLARVFVYPSMYEGFGLPILEAMAVGTPVLTSNVSSLPEVAGDAALLINPYSSADIAEGIKKLHTDNSLREHYKAKGIERSLMFTWDKCAAIVKSVIHLN